MDAFYASVEQRDDPSLAGKPLAVGGQPTSAAWSRPPATRRAPSASTRRCRWRKAVRLCPSLTIVRPDFARYKAASQAVFSIFREVTPLVEPLSLDEAYLDVTENAWNEPLATTVARRLKERIRADTGLTASAGVAPNKFLAKIASGWKKPDGLTVISPERVEPFLQKLPVDALWGVGPVTARKLRARGIERLVDVRTVDPAALRETVGSLADWLRQLAQGIDERPVVPNRETKSSGSENTYPEDLTDLAADSRGNRGYGQPRRELACAQGVARPNGDDQSPLQRLHDRNAQSIGGTDAGCRRARRTGGTIAGPHRRRPPTGSPPRRQRAQFLRRRRPGGSARSTAVR